jgi:hypothetical protein
MMHLLGVLLLSISFGAGAANQSPAANAEARADIKPGDYSGELKEQNGTRAAKVKITLRNITADGRVTARVQSSHNRKACQKRLPLNGLVLPDGNMRLEVDDGAPDGCERLYVVKLEPGGTVTGTYEDATKQRVRKPNVQK